MAILVTKTVDYLEWDGMEIHLKKCGVTAMDMRNGQGVATDSINLHGQPFPQNSQSSFPTSRTLKHLGLRMAMDGNFLAEKEHVRTED